MTRKPPPHRRSRDPLRKAQLAPRVIQPGPSPLAAEMAQGVPTLAEVAAHLAEQRDRGRGRTRTAGGRTEMWDGFMWVCAEPVDNNPEGMCSYPVESEPCPLHPGVQP